MAAKLDLIGHRFGSLKVRSTAPSRPGARPRFWKCVCDCGTITEVSTSNLRCGYVQSCGCSRGPLPAEWSQSPEYMAWCNMRYRCDNPDDKDYKNYGGRGITYCEEWQDFLKFAKDMGHKPRPELSLERVDNDGPYCKANCEWATRKVQNNNTRATRRFRTLQP